MRQGCSPADIFFDRAGRVTGVPAQATGAQEPSLGAVVVESESARASRNEPDLSARNDEAGMLPTRQLAHVVEHVRRLSLKLAAARLRTDPSVAIIVRIHQPEPNAVEATHGRSRWVHSSRSRSTGSIRERGRATARSLRPGLVAATSIRVRR